MSTHRDTGRARRLAQFVAAVAAVGLGAVGAVLPAAGAYANYCDGTPDPSTSTYVKPFTTGTTYPAYKGRVICDTSTGSIHTGQDWYKSVNEFNEIATNKGVVIDKDYDTYMGYYLVIRIGDGNRIAYAHTTHRYVDIGDTVAKGDVIAISGESGTVTGDHEHYSMFKGSWNGWYSTHFYDPVSFLSGHGVTWTSTEWN
ncbi:MAG: M23 family metallopeptidase [Microbacteriaceae bacterium]